MSTLLVILLFTSTGKAILTILGILGEALVEPIDKKDNNS